MPNTGNLKPFPKGVSGNPKGRPPTKGFAQTLRQRISDAEGDEDILRKIADALLEKAATGDIQAIKEVADRLDGKPVAMTADVTNKLDDLSNEALDAAIVALKESVANASPSGEKPTSPSKLIP